MDGCSYFGAPGLGLFVRRDAEGAQDLGHLLGVDAAGVGHVLLAAFVDVHVAHLALESLLDESVQERPAVVAEREAFVIVDDKAVRHVDIEALSCRNSLQVILLNQKTPQKLIFDNSIPIQTNKD